MPRLAADGRRPFARRRASIGSRLVLLLFLLSSVGGLFAATHPPAVSADELQDAYDKQAALEKLIAKQKAAIRSLTASQATLSARISTTKASLSEINANLTAVKTQIVGMVVDVARSQNTVDELVATGQVLDRELADIERQEADKQAELDARKALLASRIVDAYDADRTSILETFLSGADFTDVLTEVGYHLDFAEQDQLLAAQIAEDQQVLDVLHASVEAARGQTTELHALAAESALALDAQLKELAAARKELKQLEDETAALLAQQQANYAKLAADKKLAQSTLEEQLAAQKKLEALIAKLVAEQLAAGGIPSVYNGTFQWPMKGRVTQEFGCTGFSWEPAYGSCAHFHRGIDIANVMYTPIYAAGAGKVIFAGRSPYDPAWIVIIAHSSHLVSWYGHVDNRTKPPVVKAGQYVAKGQLIAYNGLTGYTTGPHLHWAVQLDGTWVNPRLFLPR